jgi:uncharacterized SAM-binding protein YcdF (DUF218 family)
VETRAARRRRRPFEPLEERLRSSPIVGLLAGTLVGLLVEDLGLPSVVSYWGDVGVLVPIGALAGWLLARTGLRTLVVATAGSLSVVWLLVAFTPLTTWLAAGLLRSDPPARADAVYVFASSIQKDRELSAVALARVLHGVELVAHGDAAALVLFDLTPPQPSYREAAEGLVARLGVRGEVVVAGRASNTREEAVGLAALCRERGWKRVLVVTSPYHSRRACAAVEHAGIETICSPSTETLFDVENLERSAERRRAFSSAIHEWVGLWVYRRRGWIDAS